MPGFNNGVVHADNVRFDGGSYPGEVTTDGQLLIGSSVAPNIRVATLAATIGQGVSVSNGHGTITIAGIDATTLSKGVVLLATDLETIAGVLATVVTTPSNLTAKLGLQTANSFVYGQGSSSALGWTNAATDGQILVGSSIGPPTATNISSGTNVSVVNAHNSITINSTGAVASTFDADSGSATPLVNVLNIDGGTSVGGQATNINTIGSSNTISVCLNNSISQPNTNSTGTQGLYSLGGDRFIHNYGTGSTYVGDNAGNLSNTGVNNTGIGITALTSITSGLNNTAVGQGAAHDMTTAKNCTAVGINSMYFSGSIGEYNTAVGSRSAQTMSSNNCTAIGSSALQTCSGDDNTAVGASSLLSTSGTDNTAIGYLCMGGAVVSGIQNTSVGKSSCYQLSSGGGNTVTGFEAASGLQTGTYNDVYGAEALKHLSTGSSNIAIGSSSGNNYTTAESSNILIRNPGVLGENNAIHIGTQGSTSGLQNSCYIAGINGVTIASPDLVTISTTTGQLGVTGAVALSYPTQSGTATPALGSLTINGSNGVSSSGAGSTVTIAGIDATTLAYGVVELATNVEAIAGTDAAKAIVSSSLGAKLGSQTANAFMYGNGSTNALAWTAAASDGQLLIGNSLGAPVATTLSAGTNIAISVGHGSTSIAAGGSVASDFSTDSGSAVPSSNILTVSGSNGIGTSGAGSTVTISGKTATTAQIGVVELATNAQAIAGTDTANAITSAALSAKLGSQTANAFMYGNSTSSALGWTAAATNGQLLIGSTGFAPVCSTLTQGTGVSIANAAGSITISAGATIPTTFNADAGSATPSANAITFSGGTGISTSATGATVTINANSATSAAKGIVQLATLAEVKTGTDAAKVLTPSTFTGYMSDLNFSGFVSWSAGAPYWSTTGTTFNLLVGGTGYILGGLITWLGSQSIALTVKSVNWIYINSSGNIAVTTSRTDALFVNNIVLFEAWVDASVTPKISVVRENHPYNFPVESSNYQHDIINTVIANYNNGANIVLVGANTVGISGTDEFEDHGISTIITDSAGAAVNWTFCYTNALGFWTIDSVGTSFLAKYNNAGTITNLVNGFAVFRLYLSKDSANTTTPTYYAVYDTAKYTSQSLANTSISNGSPAFATNELVYIELAQLGFVTVEHSTGNITNVVIQKATARSQSVVAGGNNANLITVNAAGFTGWLGATDITVQQSLTDLDQVLIGGTLGYVLEGGGAGAKPTYVNAAILAWIAIGASQNLATNVGYICNAGGALSLALPATSAVGKQISVTLAGSTSWKITQAAGQQIQIGSNTTTAGATGYISSNLIGDTVTMICKVANTTWQVINMVGNINYN